MRLQHASTAAISRSHLEPRPSLQPQKSADLEASGEPCRDKSATSDNKALACSNKRAEEHESECTMPHVAARSHRPSSAQLSRPAIVAARIIHPPARYCIANNTESEASGGNRRNKDSRPKIRPIPASDFNVQATLQRGRKT